MQGLPICPHCGEHMNKLVKPLEAHHQTKEQVMELLADATGVMSSGGVVPKACFVEHHEAFLRHIRFVRQGEELREMVYEEEEQRGNPRMMVLGIWPIVREG